MADTNDLFFFGDDFDAILGILEDEEELDKQFGEAADEVQLEDIVRTVPQEMQKQERTETTQDS